MRTRVVLALLTLALATSGSAQFRLHRTGALLPVRQNGKWGYIDRTGKIVIKPQFLSAEEFSEGLAAVTVRTKQGLVYGYIGLTGKFVISPRFENPGYFREGMAQMRVGDRTGYINKAGKVVVKPIYGFDCGDFHEGLARVQIGLGISGKVAYIDSTGKMIIPTQFEAGTDFAEGLAAVQVKKKWGFIDRTGKMVIQPQFDNAFGFSEGLSPVSTGERYYVSAKTGKTDKDIIVQNAKWGFIDKSGAMVIQPTYDMVLPFSDGMAAVMIGEMIRGKWGYIDKTGKAVIEPGYSMATEFSDGLAAVLVGRYNMEETPPKPLSLKDMPKWIYIDKTGKFIWKDAGWRSRPMTRVTSYPAVPPRARP